VIQRAASHIVVDASVVVAALVDGGPAGTWAASLMSSASLVAPAHLPVEAASALRRLARARLIGADVATLAHVDLLDLRLQLYP
jgi:predicted nucleic acid-binding protein